MPNDSLGESREIIERLIDEETLPDPLVDGISLEDLLELVQEVTTQELRTTTFDEVSEAEQEEVLRSVVERIALKVGLICLQVNPSVANNQASYSIPIPADVLVAVYTELLREGGTTVQITVS